MNHSARIAESLGIPPHLPRLPHPPPVSPLLRRSQNMSKNVQIIHFALNKFASRHKIYSFELKPGFSRIVCRCSFVVDSMMCSCISFFFFMRTQKKKSNPNLNFSWIADRLLSGAFLFRPETDGCRSECARRAPAPSRACCLHLPRFDRAFPPDEPLFQFTRFHSWFLQCAAPSNIWGMSSA